MNVKQKWVLLSFSILIFFCALLAILGGSISPYAGTKISDAGVEGLKISISALVGALSSLIGGSHD